VPGQPPLQSGGAGLELPLLRAWPVLVGGDAVVAADLAVAAADLAVAAADLVVAATDLAVAAHLAVAAAVAAAVALHARAAAGPCVGTSCASPGSSRRHTSLP
jgi:hypothetical protein